MEPTLQLITSKELQSTPWKNGGGSTREISVFPENASFDDFIWRVSIAEVERSGAFSNFAGVDRQIVLTRGQHMILKNHTTRQSHTLSPFEAYFFTGEDRIECELPAGATSDFNLMVRRDQASGSVTCLNQACQIPLSSGHYLFHSALGEHQLRIDNQTITLAPGDSLYLPKNTNNTHLSMQPMNNASYLIAAHIHLRLTT